MSICVWLQVIISNYVQTQVIIRTCVQTHLNKYKHGLRTDVTRFLYYIGPGVTRCINTCLAN